MTDHQRTALIAMTTGMAVVLHVLFFEWSTEWDPPGGRYIFTALTCEGVDSGCLRIWYDSATYQDSVVSVIIGIILPLLMICYAVYMWLGIKSANREQPGSAAPKDPQQ